MVGPPKIYTWALLQHYRNCDRLAKVFLLIIYLVVFYSLRLTGCVTGQGTKRKYFPGAIFFFFYNTREFRVLKRKYIRVTTKWKMMTIFSYHKKEKKKIYAEQLELLRMERKSRGLLEHILSPALKKNPISRQIYL